MQDTRDDEENNIRIIIIIINRINNEQPMLAGTARECVGEREDAGPREMSLQIQLSHKEHRLLCCVLSVQTLRRIGIDETRELSGEITMTMMRSSRGSDDCCTVEASSNSSSKKKVDLF